MTPLTPDQIANNRQEVEELTASILSYIADNEFEDLIQRCLEDIWTLDQAREHVAFKAMLLEWYLNPSEDPNPERYALKRIKSYLSPEDWNQLDASLKIH